MNGKQLSYEATNTVMFKPMGALNSNFSPLSSSNQIDSILNGNSLNMVRSSQSSNGLGSNNMNQFMNKPNDMDSGGNRRLLISNGSQMPMYSNGNLNLNFCVELDEIAIINFIIFILRR